MKMLDQYRKIVGEAGLNILGWNNIDAKPNIAPKSTTVEAIGLSLSEKLGNLKGAPGWKRQAGSVLDDANNLDLYKPVTAVDGAHLFDTYLGVNNPTFREVKDGEQVFHGARRVVGMEIIQRHKPSVEFTTCQVNLNEAEQVVSASLSREFIPDFKEESPIDFVELKDLHRWPKMVSHVSEQTLNKFVGFGENVFPTLNSVTTISEVGEGKGDRVEEVVIEVDSWYSKNREYMGDKLTLVRKLAPKSSWHKYDTYNLYERRFDKKDPSKYEDVKIDIQESDSVLQDQNEAVLRYMVYGNEKGLIIQIGMFEPGSGDDFSFEDVIEPVSSIKVMQKIEKLTNEVINFNQQKEDLNDERREDPENMPTDDRAGDEAPLNGPTLQW